MDLRRLQLLDTFERVGTVRAVGAELHLSPSTVSQQLAVLEKEAGVALFERTGRVLRLTPLGLFLVDRAREVRDQVAALEGELHERAERGFELRVAGFASSVEPVLLRTVRELHRRDAGLRLTVLEIEPRDSLMALRRGECEVAVTVDEQDGALFDPTIEVISLAADPMLLVAPVGHRIEAASVVSLQHLAAEPWALDLPRSYLGELVPRACRLAGFEPLVAGRFSSASLLIAHVMAGLSIGVLPALAAPARPGLVRRPVADLDDRRIVAAVRRGQRRRPSVGRLIEALRLVVADPAIGLGPTATGSTVATLTS